MFYFAYGSNLHKEQMKGRCPDSKAIAAARLPGYLLTFRQVADIVPVAGANVPGAVYTISSRDLEALDRYEGYPGLYGREFVTVLTDRGPVQALVYVMAEDKYRFAPPVHHYAKTIHTGYRDWGLNTLYLYDALEQFKPSNAIAL